MSPGSDVLCRACGGARPSGAVRRLFAGDGATLAAMLSAVALVQVMENDGLPSSICLRCIRKLKNAFEFKHLCRNSDAALRSRLGTSPSTSVKEEASDERVGSPNSIGGGESSEAERGLCEDFEIAFGTKDFRGRTVELDASYGSRSLSFLESAASSDDAREGEPRCDVGTEEPPKLERDEVFESDFCVVPESIFSDGGFGSPEGAARTDRIGTDKSDGVSCEICNQSFSSRQNLARHAKRHQKNTKNKLCTFCGKSFLRADDLKRHTRIHTGERPYSCDRCPKKYKQSSELKDHMNSHSAAKCYVCTECGKSLATRNGLYVHMKVHRGEKNRECKICGNRFITNGELNSHINHIHSHEKPFECFYENCTRAFTTKLSLKTHLRAHTGEKHFKCSICEKSLATPSSLHEHMRIHTGEKPKECTVCDRRLTNSQALKKHMRIHTGERPYQCKICFEKFICGSTLRSHIKSKHMEKQFECSVCHKMFALGTKLRQHMRLHTEEKTHTCHVCNASFAQRSNLQQHLKSHEKQVSADIDKSHLLTDITPIAQLSMPHMLISQYL